MSTHTVLTAAKLQAAPWISPDCLPPYWIQAREKHKSIVTQGSNWKAIFREAAVRNIIVIL